MGFKFYIISLQNVDATLRALSMRVVLRVVSVTARLDLMDLNATCVPMAIIDIRTAWVGIKRVGQE